MTDLGADVVDVLLTGLLGAVSLGWFAGGCWLCLVALGGAS